MNLSMIKIYICYLFKIKDEITISINLKGENAINTKMYYLGPSVDQLSVVLWMNYQREAQLSVPNLDA